MQGSEHSSAQEAMAARIPRIRWAEKEKIVGVILSQTAEGSEVSTRVKGPLAPRKRTGAGRYGVLEVTAHVKLLPQLERKRSADLQVPHVIRASRSSGAHIITALDMTSDRKPAASPDFRASNSLLCMRMATDRQHGST